jgi:uncharacterized protein
MICVVLLIVRFAQCIRDIRMPSVAEYLPISPAGTDWKRLLVPSLRAAFAPERIIIFGSQVWGEPHADSDVDICIVVNSSDATPLERAVLAHRALGVVPFAKDILVQTIAEFDRFSGVQGTLQHRIAHEGQIIYERTT